MPDWYGPPPNKDNLYFRPSLAWGLSQCSELARNLAAPAQFLVDVEGGTVPLLGFSSPTWATQYLVVARARAGGEKGGTRAVGGVSLLPRALAPNRPPAKSSTNWWNQLKHTANSTPNHHRCGPNHWNQLKSTQITPNHAEINSNHPKPTNLDNARKERRRRLLRSPWRPVPRGFAAPRGPAALLEVPLGKIAAVEACPARAFPLLLRRCTRPASRFHLAATAAAVMAQRRRGGSGAAAAFEKWGRRRGGWEKVDKSTDGPLEGRWGINLFRTTRVHALGVPPTVGSVSFHSTFIQLNHTE